MNGFFFFVASSFENQTHKHLFDKARCCCFWKRMHSAKKNKVLLKTCTRKKEAWVGYEEKFLGSLLLIERGLILFPIFVLLLTLSLIVSPVIVVFSRLGILLLHPSAELFNLGL